MLKNFKDLNSNLTKPEFKKTFTEPKRRNSIDEYKKSKNSIHSKLGCAKNDTTVQTMDKFSKCARIAQNCKDSDGEPYKQNHTSFDLSDRIEDIFAPIKEKNIDDPCTTGKLNDQIQESSDTIHKKRISDFDCRSLENYDEFQSKYLVQAINYQATHSEFKTNDSLQNNSIKYIKGHSDNNLQMNLGEIDETGEYNTSDSAEERFMQYKPPPG